MKPSERLKKIEYRLYQNLPWISDREDQLWILNRVKNLTEALEFYANKDNWKDVWEERGNESSHFKYFCQLRQRTDDFEKLEEPHHFYAGRRARKALEE